MRRYCRELPIIFGFKQISVLFYDDENNALYSIAMGNFEDHKLMVKQKKSQAKDAGEAEIIDAMESMRDVHLPEENLI